jgi:hypothetical protein
VHTRSGLTLLKLLNVLPAGSCLPANSTTAGGWNARCPVQCYLYSTAVPGRPHGLLLALDSSYWFVWRVACTSPQGYHRWLTIEWCLFAPAIMHAIRLCVPEAWQMSSMSSTLQRRRTAPTLLSRWGV